MATPFSQIARITKTHGLKGEVLAVAAGDLTSIDELIYVLCEAQQTYLVPPPTSGKAFTISGARSVPKGVLITFAECGSIDEAQALVGCMMLVDAGIVPDTFGESEEDEAQAALIGMRVIDATRGDLGRVEEVLVTGANDVWVVNGPFGQVLIPVVDHVVISVQEDIHVELLEGLIDDEADEAEGE